MTQFHEGQEVEVWGANMYPWRKAKIVGNTGKWGAPALPENDKHYFVVEFPDSKRAVFDADHIRARLPLTESDYDPDGINQAVRKQLASR